MVEPDDFQQTGLLTLTFLLDGEARGMLHKKGDQVGHYAVQ